VPENIIPQLAVKKVLPSKSEGFSTIIVLGDTDFDFEKD
jgi:hypothetical protein